MYYSVVIFKYVLKHGFQIGICTSLYMCIPKLQNKYMYSLITDKILKQNSLNGENKAINFQIIIQYAAFTS
jgi:hypothetical protein